MIEDGIGQFARAKNRNGGGTRELDHLGGLLRLLLRIPVRALLRVVLRRLLQVLFCLASQAAGEPWAHVGCATPSLGSNGRTLAHTAADLQLAAQDGTSSRAHQKAGAARDSAESGACAACDSVRGERPPRRARNRRSERRSGPAAAVSACGCQAAASAESDSDLAASGNDSSIAGSSPVQTVRQSSRPQSARHQSGRRHQVALIKSSKNASSQSQARHECRRPQECGALLRLPLAC